MMEEFLPSEIARAVYGYLLSEGCEDAANSFLETSPSLVECKQRVKHGKRLTHANTLLLGKSLTEVLNISCSVHSIVKQIHDKQQRGLATDGHESLAELFEQLRSCVLSDTRTEETSCTQPSSQPDMQSLLSSPHCLRTPPITATPTPSLADNYRSLVQECSEGLDLSLSPEKTIPKNKNVESPCRHPLNRPTSAPGSLGLSQLDMENESAVAAITGMGIAPVAASVVSGAPHQVMTSLHITTEASNTPVSCVVASSAVVMASTVSTVTSATTSHQSSEHFLPSAMHKNQLISADSLPDPPIIVLNSQNQSFEGVDTTGYFNVPPCAASTPQPRPTFMPEDTAFIVYPPLTTDHKPKKAPLKEKTNLRRSGRLRKLLPKPYRQDPPNIIHIKVLPQTIDEENEDDPDEENQMELAKQLPDSQEKLIPENEASKLPDSEGKMIPENECDRHIIKDNEIEVKKNMEVVTTTSDKENVSDENILKGESVDKSTNSLPKECDKETSTPKPPPLRKNISRSTPRRNSHVRALSFNTPLKGTVGRKSNTSPKMPKIKFSPRSTKLSCVKRSSLFSPKNDKELSHLSEGENTLTSQVEEDEEQILTEKNQTALENSPLYKLPIATRSPAPKLSSAWQEVNDVRITDKPVWDEKIRSFALGDFEDPEPPPKKGPQDNQSNMEDSVNKVKNNSPTISNNQSLKSAAQDSCPSKTTRKARNKPANSSIASKKVEDVTPPKVTPKMKNAAAKSSKNKPVNKNKKSPPLKKTQQLNSTLELKEDILPSEIETITNQERQRLVEKSQINTKDKNERSIKELTNVNHQAEGNEKLPDNNILLEDLVVSSNSCFPQANDEVRIESKSIKEDISQVFDSNQNNSLIPSVTNSSSPTFIQPSMIVLETPSKEFQVSSDPKTFTLTTPLIKSIRQETSILEEDLLLTPSLPPTPQVNSSPRNCKTPCKPVTESPNGSKGQTVVIISKENKRKSPQNNKITERSPSQEEVHLSSCKEKSNLLSNRSESKMEGNMDIKNPLLSNQTQSFAEKERTHESIQSSGRPSLTSTTDTSEIEDETHENCSEIVSQKLNSSENKINNDRKLANNKRNHIYSTTESSDEENNVTKSVANRRPNKTKLSKLASALLENERKSLNQKSKKNELTKKLSKNQSHQSPESISSVNSNQSKKSIAKSIKKKNSKNSTKVSKQNKSVKGNFPKINLNSQETVEKQTTPESMRKQLQSDLLKCERKIIFGDGFPSTSDSESDKDIFEKKKSVTAKTKLNKDSQKKKTPSKFVLSDDDSSSDNSNKKCLTTNKCVRFKSTPGINFKSPMKQSSVVISDCKLSPIRSAEKINCKINIVNNPSTHFVSTDSFNNLGQEKNSDFLDKISAISVNSSNVNSESETIQNGVYSRPALPKESMLNEQDILRKSDNALDSDIKLQYKITSSDSRSKQSQAPVGLEKKLGLTDPILDKCSASSQDGKTVITANKFPETSEQNRKDTTDCNKTKDKENETEVSLVNSLSTHLENNHLVSTTAGNHSQNNGKAIEQQQQNNIEDKNEISIKSTSLYKRVNTSSMLDQFDIHHRDTFQVDEGNVVLSYSKIIKHHYYSPFLRSESVQSENTDSPQTDVSQKDGDKNVSTKEQAVKRRIQLIPIEDDKYEQKLQVDYDFIDDENVIINFGNRRLSSEIDILDCSTSSILSSDTGCVRKQSLNFIRNTRDVCEGKQEAPNPTEESTLIANKNSQKNERSTVNDMSRSLKHCNEKDIKDKCSRQTHDKLLNDSSKNKKQERNKQISRNPTNEINSIIQRSHHLHHKNERDEALYEGGKNKSRHRKEVHFQSERRREREGEGRYDRLHNRRDYRRRYSERWTRESDRRGFSERRNYSSQKHFRRGFSPESLHTSRHDSEKHYKTRDTDNDLTDIGKLKEVLSKLEKHDLDRVDNLEKRAIERLIKQDNIDPRATQVLTYSDIERNESSHDEADSLMDFAVITKPKDSRKTPENLPRESNLSVCQDPSSSGKRKAATSIGENPEICHVEKKLKLGEVEMKEAKSVLKHKMTDMLNVLHPDTSNEAT